MQKSKLILSVLMMFFFSPISFSETREMTIEESIGKKLYEGRILFENGGPSCVACHNINTKNMISGGVYAKDLTDVYSRLGEGISGWLLAPPFPAMEVSFINNPLTETERNNLQAFFKYVHEENEIAAAAPPKDYLLIGGFGGLFMIIIFISLIWSVRKKQMVKQEIFDRQIKARDAKF